MLSPTKKGKYRLPKYRGCLEKVGLEKKVPICAAATAFSNSTHQRNDPRGVFCTCMGPLGAIALLSTFCVQIAGLPGHVAS